MNRKLTHLNNMVCVDEKEKNPFKRIHTRMSSRRKTVMQQAHATAGSPFSFQASILPTSSAARPDMMLSVASMMAGNVMTASVA